MGPLAACVYGADKALPLHDMVMNITTAGCYLQRQYILLTLLAYSSLHDGIMELIWSVHCCYHCGMHNCFPAYVIH